METIKIFEMEATVANAETKLKELSGDRLFFSTCSSLSYVVITIFLAENSELVRQTRCPQNQVDRFMEDYLVLQSIYLVLKATNQT